MDDLGSHKSAAVRRAVEGAGCRLLFLPPYNPDLNPIENAFSKLKRLFRSGGYWTASRDASAGSSSGTADTTDTLHHLEER